MECIVAVTGEGQRRKAWHLRRDAEFFVQLAYQRLLRCLAGFHLAAWKLPQAGKRLALRPLCQKDTPVRVDQRTGGDQKQPLSGFAHSQRSCQ
ncbi:hypothetical protein D3C87_1943100 [compost metagenome]